MFNVNKWKSDVKKLETDIKAHKKSMRESGHNPSTGEYAGLYDWKNQVTMLYRIRAQIRGKLHSKKFLEKFELSPGKYNNFTPQVIQTIETLEDQRAWILDDVWGAYQLPDEVAVPA